MIFAYFGPETTLPLSSTLACVLGVAMVFGRQFVRFASLLLRGVFRKVGIGKQTPMDPAWRRSGATVRLDGPARARPLHAANKMDHIDS
jgi:hypothetical protein